MSIHSEPFSPLSKNSEESSSYDEFNCKRCPHKPCPRVGLRLSQLFPDETTSLYGLFVLLHTCDSKCEVAVHYRFPKRKQIMSIAIKIAQQLFGFSYWKARFLLRKLNHFDYEDEKEKIIDESKRSFIEIQKILLEVLNTTKSELDFIHLRNMRDLKEPAIDYIKHAIENGIDFGMYTENPPASEFFHLVLQTYLSGSLLQSGAFYWESQEKSPDYDNILKGLNVIYKGDLKGYFKTEAVRHGLCLYSSMSLCRRTGAISPLHFQMVHY